VTRIWLVLAALLGTAALAGCGSSPVTHFYTLNPAAEPAAAGAGGKAAYVVAIGAVTPPAGLAITEYLAREKELALVAAANQFVPIRVGSATRSGADSPKPNCP